MSSESTRTEVHRAARRRLLAVLVCSGLPLTAAADLRSTALSSLVAQSEVIAFARVESISAGDLGAGEAVLVVQRILKGTLPAEPLHIMWSSEVHEQRIGPVPAVRLLFLNRKADGKLAGTHYGRSYWPVETDDAAGAACRHYSVFVYPLNMLRVDEKSRRAGLVSTRLSASGKPVPIVCLDDTRLLLTPPKEVSK